MSEMLTHETFINQFMKYINSNLDDADMGNIDPIDYEPGREVILCPEPVRFLKEMDHISSDQEKCREKFEELCEQCDPEKGFEKITLDPIPSEFPFWFNSTINGINLRPGNESFTGKPVAVELGDTAAHGLMAGQTGSGKSTLLNNIIFNMIAEYPPWELDLYLADFKRVEFSRYMNNSEFKTPHVCACAATSEVRYVVSMIQYLVDCMNARETFFARIGVDKIATFRRRYPNVVLPRILLIVDEFQQLFLEASPKESDKIHQLMTAIVKKGRATGVHVLFSSQEITSTLSRSDLANFRLRIALNCTASTSMDVLGNPCASMIEPKKQALVNAKDGTEETNQQFEVPYIEIEIREDSDQERPYFNIYLTSMYKLAEEYGFSKPQKFYQEDEQPDWSTLEWLVNGIREYRESLYDEETRTKYFDVLTLGPYVTYSNLKYDYQTLFLEYGRRKNILAVSPRAEDLAYLQKLFALNFTTSPRKEVLGVDYVHEVYSFQPVVQGLFPLEENLGDGKISCHVNPEDLDELKDRFNRIRVLYQLCQDAKTPMDFVERNIRMNLDQLRSRTSAADLKKIEEDNIRAAQQVYGEIPIEEIPAKCEEILQGNRSEMEKQIARNLQVFCRYEENPYEAFPPTVYWISGIESVERIPEWLYTMMKTSMDYNILFIFMASSEFDQMAQVARYCDYLFVGGTNRRIYEQLNVNFTHKESDSIALDLQIRSMDEEKSFKKFRCDFDKIQRPTVPFERYL